MRRFIRTSIVVALLAGLLLMPSAVSGQVVRYGVGYQPGYHGYGYSYYQPGYYHYSYVRPYYSSFYGSVPSYPRSNWSYGYYSPSYARYYYAPPSYGAYYGYGYPAYYPRYSLYFRF